MNILFIVPYVPGPVRVRPYNLIRSLAQRGNRITLATLASEEEEMEDLNRLRGICQQVIAARMPKWRSWLNVCRAAPSAQPLQASYCWQPALAHGIAWSVNQDSADPFDVIHVEHLRGAVYGTALKGLDWRGLNRPPIVWDSVDCISHLFRQAAGQSKKRLSRWMARFELKRTEAYEAGLAAQFERTLVTSSVDQAAFRSLPGLKDRDLPIQVLPNGVDLDYFCPGDVKRDPETLVISGKMSYHANVTMTLYMIDEVMPRIWGQRPDVRVTVVGKNPPREVLALANHPLVRVTGTVENIPAYLQKSSIAAAPIQYGAGIQNKVLEAMGTATPVVTTPQGNSAISAAPGRDLLVAENAEEFANRVLFLLEHPEAQRQIGQAGRKFVETHYRWDQIAAQLESIYQETKQEWISKNISSR